MKNYRSKPLAVFGICILAFTSFLDFTIVNTALPFIQRYFKVNVLDLQWVANIFPIILSMTMISVGKFADYLGCKKVFYTGVILFGVAAVFAGFSPSIGWLIFFRGVQGLGASIVFISSSALIAETFPSEERAPIIGIFGGVTGAGLMLGPFFGGILIGALDWRYVFWINIPLIVIGLITCLFTLKGESKQAKELKIEWKGFFLLVFGLGSMMYGIISLAGNDVSYLLSWILLILGILCLFSLIRIDLKAKEPLLNFTIFKNPVVLLAVTTCAVAGCVSYVYMFFDPLLLKDVFDLSAYTIGFMIAIIPAAQVVISFGFKYLLKWFGLANLFIIGIIAPLASSILQLFIFPDTPLWYFVLPFALLGITWGLANTAMITAVTQEMKPNEIGEGIGTNATLWNVFGATLLAISSAIFHLQQSNFLESFRITVGFNILFMVLAIIFAFWVRSKISKKQT